MFAGPYCRWDERRPTPTTNHSRSFLRTRGAMKKARIARRVSPSDLEETPSRGPERHHCYTALVHPLVVAPVCRVLNMTFSGGGILPPLIVIIGK